VLKLVALETAVTRSTHQPALITDECRVWAKAIVRSAQVRLDPRERFVAKAEARLSRAAHTKAVVSTRLRRTIAISPERNRGASAESRLALLNRSSATSFTARAFRQCSAEHLTLLDADEV
jgi:hypothetical protein